MASNQTRLSLQIPFEIPCTAFQIRFGRQIKKYFLWWPASLVKGYEAGPRWMHCLDLQYIALQLSIVQCQYWPVSASAVGGRSLYCIYFDTFTASFFRMQSRAQSQPNRKGPWHGHGVICMVFIWGNCALYICVICTCVHVYCVQSLPNRPMGRCCAACMCIYV